MEQNGRLRRKSKTDGDTPRPLTLYQCDGDHAFFVPYDACPVCGANLLETESPPDAWLVSRTTVRVNPSGIPFHLGLARVESGAKTLCIIESDIDDEESVVIYLRDGLYYARSKTG